MEVILLERIPRLGQMGDVVKVRNGYARNFLLPQGKALRANEMNKTRFESQRTELEARNLERRKEAEAVHEKLDGNSYLVVRSAGATGQLYGSVSTRDVAAVLADSGFRVARAQIDLRQPIKTIGMHEVTIVLHPEVESIIVLNVARSEDEAERQARGEDLTGREPEPREEESELDAEPDDMFEHPEEAVPAAGESESGAADYDEAGDAQTQDEEDA
jgi:large subunit ribosomal protein L9